MLLVIKKILYGLAHFVLMTCVVVGVTTFFSTAFLFIKEGQYINILINLPLFLMFFHALGEDVIKASSSE